MSMTGTNPSYPFVLATCDATQSAQIFAAQCPPAPPPPVLPAAAPCGGGPALYSQTQQNGQSVCLTNPSGYSLDMTNCNTASTDQMFTGINSNKVQILSTAVSSNWWRAP